MSRNWNVDPPRDSSREIPLPYLPSDADRFLKRNRLGRLAGELIAIERDFPKLSERNPDIQDRYIWLQNALKDVKKDRVKSKPREETKQPDLKRKSPKDAAKAYHHGKEPGKDMTAKDSNGSKRDVPVKIDLDEEPPPYKPNQHSWAGMKPIDQKTAEMKAIEKDYPQTGNCPEAVLRRYDWLAFTHKVLSDASHSASVSQPASSNPPAHPAKKPTKNDIPSLLTPYKVSVDKGKFSAKPTYQKSGPMPDQREKSSSVNKPGPSVTNSRGVRMYDDGFTSLLYQQKPVESKSSPFPKRGNAKSSTFPKSVESTKSSPFSKSVESKGSPFPKPGSTGSNVAGSYQSPESDSSIFLRLGHKNTNASNRFAKTSEANSGPFPKHSGSGLEAKSAQGNGVSRYSWPKEPLVKVNMQGLLKPTSSKNAVPNPPQVPSISELGYGKATGGFSRFSDRAVDVPGKYQSFVAPTYSLQGRSKDMGNFVPVVTTAMEGFQFQLKNADKSAPSWFSNPGGPQPVSFAPTPLPPAQAPMPQAYATAGTFIPQQQPGIGSLFNMMKRSFGPAQAEAQVAAPPSYSYSANQAPAPSHVTTMASREAGFLAPTWSDASQWHNAPSGVGESSGFEANSRQQTASNMSAAYSLQKQKLELQRKTVEKKRSRSPSPWKADIETAEVDKGGMENPLPENSSFTFPDDESVGVDALETLLGIMMKQRQAALSSGKSAELEERIAALRELTERRKAERETAMLNRILGDLSAAEETEKSQQIAREEPKSKSRSRTPKSKSRKRSSSKGKESHRDSKRAKPNEPKGEKEKRSGPEDEIPVTVNLTNTVADIAPDEMSKLPKELWRTLWADGGNVSLEDASLILSYVAPNSPLKSFTDLALAAKGKSLAKSSQSWKDAVQTLGGSGKPEQDSGRDRKAPSSRNGKSSSRGPKDAPVARNTTGESAKSLSKVSSQLKRRSQDKKSQLGGNSKPANAAPLDRAPPFSPHEFLRHLDEKVPLIPFPDFQNVASFGAYTGASRASDFNQTQQYPTPQQRDFDRFGLDAFAGNRGFESRGLIGDRGAAAGSRLPSLLDGSGTSNWPQNQGGSGYGWNM